MLLLHEGIYRITAAGASGGGGNSYYKGAVAGVPPSVLFKGGAGAQAEEAEGAHEEEHPPGGSEGEGGGRRRSGGGRGKRRCDVPQWSVDRREDALDILDSLSQRRREQERELRLLSEGEPPAVPLLDVSRRAVRLWFINMVY